MLDDTVRRTGLPAAPAQAAPAAAPAPAPGGWRNWPVLAARLVRVHWLLSVLLAAGAALRVVTVAAYHPALLYIDTPKYLYNEYPGSDPHGYNVLLRAVLSFGDLGTVALLQHAAGLAMAVVLYAVLARRQAARWLAALAVAPVLLDAYWLDVEHLIMPDLWFMALLVAALAVLLWRPQPAVRFAVAAGVLIGLSATFKLIGEVLLLPGLVYLLAAGGGWRRVLGVTVSFTVAFLVPVLAYCTVSWAHDGHFRLSAGQSVNGRMAAAADCATLTLSPALRRLCPDPAAQALGPDYLEKSKDSPLHSQPIPPGAERKLLIASFASAVEHQQPLRVAASILRDAARLFALTRDGVPSVTPISRWQFQTAYPNYYPAVSVSSRHQIMVGTQKAAYRRFRFTAVPPAWGGIAHVDRPAARFLRSYQLNGGYTPGPLLALCTLIGLAASILAFARRRNPAARHPAGQHPAARHRAGHHRAGNSPASDLDPDEAAPGRLPAAAAARQLALATLLFWVTGVVLLLAADITQFSWRYQLPGLVTLPPAAAAGAAALVLWSRSRSRRGRPPGLVPASSQPPRGSAPGSASDGQLNVP
jgi:hypothetical protein